MSNYSFLSAPSIKMRRNKFNNSYNHDSTMNVGRLYPLYVQEVQPGATISMDCNTVIRTTSPFIRPIMSPLYLDSFFFFVPYRLICDEFPELFGEASPNDWKAKVNDRTLPVFDDTASLDDLTGGVIDCLGQLNGRTKAFGNVLSVRAFAKIYNEWFRDENLIDPMLIQTGDFSTSERPNMNEWSPSNYTGKCPKIAKYMDYFTSALPDVQKGSAVTIPILSDESLMPLTTTDTSTAYPYPLEFLTDRELVPNGMNIAFLNTTGVLNEDYWTNLLQFGRAQMQNGSDYVQIGSNESYNNVYGSNLYGNLGSMQLNIPVTDMRLGFQLQRILERLARSGSRYTEFIQSFFGVTNPDARLQRSEFLGGGHTPLNILQVSQTSQSTETQALGELGAYSWTNTSNKWSKSFTEFGVVIGCFAIRFPHTYSNGVERFHTRKRMTDFYLPPLANISEQPIYQDELYTDGTDTIYDDDSRTVFGFQEAWSDIRTRKNRVSGQMSPSATNTLSVWGLYDNYANAPVLSQEFVEEDVAALDTKLSVPSSSLDSFIISLQYNQSIVLPMPLFSEPGLIDHH